jgi:MFS family permease
MPASYWWVVVVGSVLTLARFSEAFLILRAQEIGFSLALIPAVLVIMSVVYAAAAYPAGLLSDRMNRRYVLMIGVGALIGADLILTYVTSVVGVLLGTALWGLHMGFTQGLLSTLVADAAPAQLRGTAFGVFNLVCGLMMLAASVLAGFLWGQFGAPTTFLTGAMFAALALLGLVLTRGRGQPG